MSKGDREDLKFVQERIARESEISERIDDQGNRWRKVYFGGGAHFQNWLKQCRELGEVLVEEISPTGFGCYEETGEKLYRIWMKLERNAEEESPA